MNRRSAIDSVGAVMFSRPVSLGTETPSSPAIGQVWLIPDPRDCSDADRDWQVRLCSGNDCLSNGVVAGQRAIVLRGSREFYCAKGVIIETPDRHWWECSLYRILDFRVQAVPGLRHISEDALVRYGLHGSWTFVGTIDLCGEWSALTDQDEGMLIQELLWPEGTERRGKR